MYICTPSFFLNLIIYFSIFLMTTNKAYILLKLTFKIFIYSQMSLIFKEIFLEKIPIQNICITQNLFENNILPYYTAQDNSV